MAIKIAWITSEETHPATPDDIVAIEYLRKQGYHVDSVVWEVSPAHRLKGYDLVIIRSPWDYSQKIEYFNMWLNQLEKNGVNLLNSVPLIRWNSSKEYLLELEKKGISILPTWLVNLGNIDASLKELQAKWGDRVVIKPTVSANSHQTYFAEISQIDIIRERVQEIVTRSPVLLQPFNHSIQKEGEFSLIFFNSPDGFNYSHSVVKKPADGDFRVQTTFGGTAVSYQPTQEMKDFATKVLSFVQYPWLYVRVDLVSYRGKLCLGELEMIEPHLYFRENKNAAQNFLEKIQNHLRPRAVAA